VRVFSYWHQGESDAPAVVKLSLLRSRQLNSGSEVEFYDQDSQAGFGKITGIPADKFSRIPLAHRSDLLRTWLLCQHGGLWADPTVYFNQAADQWLPELMEPSGLFLFHRPGRDREIANWLIGAEPKHPILQAVFERLCKFWSGTSFRNVGRPNTEFENLIFRLVNRNLWAPRIWTWRSVNQFTKLFPYMIYHYVFYDVVSRDRKLARLWQLTPKISADGPHALARLGLTSPVGKEALRLIEHPVAPVYKLKWRIKDDAIPKGSVLAALRSNALSASEHDSPNGFAIGREQVNGQTKA